MTDVIEVIKFSDISWPMELKNADGSAFNLTGYSAAIAETASAAGFNPSVAITGAAAGEITLTVQWSNDIPTYEELATRIKLTSGSDDIGLPELVVKYI